MIACAVALLLLVDVSGSVSAENFSLQRKGIAEALADPALARVVESGPPIAIAMIDWDTRADTVLAWRLLRDRTDLARAAEAVLEAPRGGEFGATHMGEAIAAGVAALAEAPCLAERMVLDVSGDGAANGGRDPATARDQAQALGVEINGLPILTDAEPELEAWYRANVATLDGFVIAAHGFESVARAMRRKILFEIAFLPEETP